jgi:transmembrane sensor
LYTATGQAKEVNYNTLTTPRGGQFRVTLPDGTAVWLNAASSIRYPTRFAGSERLVEISGEAYLEVASNAQQPFKVKITDGTTINVLGTSFNINAYNDTEQPVTTTLISGAIQISKTNKTVTLRPGQQAQMREEITVSKQVDTEQVMAWKNGLFYFKNAPLQEVMEQLSRWYDIEVVYKGKIPDKKFDGKLDRQLQLSQVIRIMQYMQLDLRIEAGNRLIVMP